MKKIIIALLGLLMLASAFYAHEGHDEEAAIKKVILSAYRDGLCNKGDIKAIKKGFHKEFRLLGVKQNKLWILPIDQWIESTQKKIEAGKFPPKEPVAMQFALIDITGRAAMVKIKFFKGKKHVYTDYLSLYEFKEGWKIVNKIFHTHK